MNRKKIIGLTGVFLVFIVNLALAIWLTSSKAFEMFSALGIAELMVNLFFVYAVEVLCLVIPSLAVLDMTKED